MDQAQRDHHDLAHGFCIHGELPGACDRWMEPDRRPSYVYVASSWRNQTQPAIVQILRSAGIACYDFKHPEEATGFHWHEVMPDYVPGSEKADAGEYLKALDHPRSIQGFDNDFAAMERADAFVLVLPCGRSAHLELGWAVGQAKRTVILLDPDEDNLVTPELMYKMVDHISPTVVDLLEYLGIE